MIGPIIVLVNKAAIVLNETEEQEITFKDGAAEIDSPYIVLSTVSITGKEQSFVSTCHIGACPI